MRYPPTWVHGVEKAGRSPVPGHRERGPRDPQDQGEQRAEGRRGGTDPDGGREPVRAPAVTTSVSGAVEAASRTGPSTASAATATAV